MLKQIHQSHGIQRAVFTLPQPLTFHQSISHEKSSFVANHGKVRVGRIFRRKPNISIRPVEGDTEQSVKVKALITVNQPVGGLLSEIGINRGLDDVTDLLGKTIFLGLVSADLDPRTGLEKPTIEAYARRIGDNDKEQKYEADIKIPSEFGQVGAVLVQNEHHKEMFFKDIVLDGLPSGPVNIPCNSFVQSKHDTTQKRVFFTTKVYVPSETPEGVRRLRQEELTAMRGDGKGQRKTGERVYDYDVYNDLGDPDSDPTQKRPVLGGKEHPYPRRCRTGRPMCKSDPQLESRSGSVYVPRDEDFSEVKELTFGARTLKSVLHALVPALETVIVDPDLGFPYFAAIDSLFNEGLDMPPLNKQGSWKDLLPNLFKSLENDSRDLLRFEPPQTMTRDEFFWIRDEEFAREVLAGVNPCCIKLVTEWPLKSSLDPKVYGPAESAITTEMVEKEIKGFIPTIEEAVAQKKLFVLDYHDLFLPFSNQASKQKGTQLYGSRTLFFLTPDGTLRPLAIELVRPPVDGKPQWKQAFTPAWHSTAVWLWRLAKTHVLAHDTGYHELVSHWLRTHCCTEPYIIAANRQLSAMHPIYRLMHPHFRYTMEINALAREALINAGGVIESSFTLLTYSIAFSSAVYDQLWRFDHEALPADLVNRGMAVEDASAPHGVRLTIEDYPYGNDGLLLWDAIKQWVTDYVTHYYPDSSVVQSDSELQAWWAEVKNVGHMDKKDEPWWPKLETPTDLIHIVTTIVWVASGHHAAVNFGQYTFGGYFPNRPAIVREKMPTEDLNEKDYKFFMEKPADYMLKTFPSQLQATKVMAVLDILSSHSVDEEYLGETIEPAWEADPVIKAAFEKFSNTLKQVEGIINERNEDIRLKNRNGSGIVPYELLKPFSGSGVTGKGVPYSISI